MVDRNLVSRCNLNFGFVVARSWCITHYLMNCEIDWLGAELQVWPLLRGPRAVDSTNTILSYVPSRPVSLSVCVAQRPQSATRCVTVLRRLSRSVEFFVMLSFFFTNIRASKITYGRKCFLVFYISFSALMFTKKRRPRARGRTPA